MLAHEIRAAYRRHFEEHGHHVLPSASLVPASLDPSVLLTTAGMQPLKPYFLGLEQPLNGKVSFVADWLSGKNFWGYFTPGVSVTLPHNGLLNIGYSIGNDSFTNNDAKNRALFVYYGITFP